MRRIVWLLALVFSASAWADSTEEAYRGADTNLLAQVRKGFETAPDSASETRRLTTLLDSLLSANLPEWPPIILAYRAALEGLTGKHSRSPWAKYHHAKAGLAKFHGLVEAHPDSVEIRMLRFSFCSQLPGFFGMRPQAENDRAALTDLVVRGRDPMVSRAYIQGVIQWILRYGDPSPEERNRLESALDPPD